MSGLAKSRLKPKMKPSQTRIKKWTLECSWPAKCLEPKITREQRVFPCLALLNGFSEATLSPSQTRIKKWTLECSWPAKCLEPKITREQHGFLCLALLNRAWGQKLLQNSAFLCVVSLSAFFFVWPF